MFVIPLPEVVLPIIECSFPPLRSALRDGIKWADAVQPDRADRWYWAHSARFEAKRSLQCAPKDGWDMAAHVPNSAIHLRVDLHKLRVLRSLDGTTPHPGRNRRSRQFWVQESLPLAKDGTLPPLSLIVDWQVVGTEPVIHVGLPARPWSYGSNPRLHWRVPVTGDADSDLEKLEFNPSDAGDEGPLILQIDETEKGAG